jgi:hypothetical protein
MNNSEIAHRRLRNQGLSKIIFKDAVDVVTQLGAVQAQDYAGAKWALGQRLKDSTDAGIDQAFADGSILRTHLLRPTWHFVTPTDIRWLLALTAPRVHAVNAFMYGQTGLDKATLKKSHTVLEKSLRGNNHLTRTELGSALGRAGIIAEGQRLGYIMMSAELDGLVCSGPRKGKQFTYALLEERVPKVKTWTREEALAEFIKRYFATRGPATLQDFTWWSGLTMADAKNGIEMVKSHFASEEINGQIYWFTGSKPPAREKSPTAYLLPNYDEYFIGFKDRSAIGDTAKQAGIKGDDPALIAHIIILDGQIVGGWRRMLNKNDVFVETSLITKLSTAEKQAVADTAERFGEFLGLPVSLTHKEYTNEQRKTRSF